jgi:hypothetical protein
VSVHDHLPAIHTHFDTSPDLSYDSIHSEHDLDDIDNNFVPNKLVQEQITFVPSLRPTLTKQDTIASRMHIDSFGISPQQPLPLPTASPALSEYTTDSLFSMAFPSLFPLGRADYSLPRCCKLDLHKWAKHLMHYCDPHFATHPRFRFFALNLIFRHRAMQRGKYLFSRNFSHHNMTVGQLQDALLEHDGPRLTSDIVRCLKTVKATQPYWQM